jgi:hypothetical protein
LSVEKCGLYFAEKSIADIKIDTLTKSIADTIANTDKV